MTGPDSDPGITIADLQKVIARDRFIKNTMAERIAALLLENMELLAIVQELQGDVKALTQPPLEAPPLD